MRVLVLAAHPDDETLGCGGTIAKHIAQGDEVTVWTLTNNMRCPTIFEDMGRAVEILGVKECTTFDLKDSYLDTMSILDLAQQIEDELQEGDLPDIVYTHSDTDLSTDHLKTFQTALTVFRPVWGKNIDLYSFEIPSGTDWSYQPFVPNVFVDIKDYIEQKKQAFAEYKTEIREFPHPRSLTSLEARARYWGTYAGLEYAEPFKLIRGIR